MLACGTTSERPVLGYSRRATACLQVRWLQELKSSTAWVVHPVETSGPSGGCASGPCLGSGSPGPLEEGRLHVNSCRHLAHLPSGCVEQVFVARQRKEKNNEFFRSKNVDKTFFKNTKYQSEKEKHISLAK